MRLLPASPSDRPRPQCVRHASPAMRTAGWAGLPRGQSRGLIAPWLPRRRKRALGDFSCTTNSWHPHQAISAMDRSFRGGNLLSPSQQELAGFPARWPSLWPLDSASMLAAGDSSPSPPEVWPPCRGRPGSVAVRPGRSRYRAASARHRGDRRRQTEHSSGRRARARMRKQQRPGSLRPPCAPAVRALARPVPAGADDPRTPSIGQARAKLNL